MPGNNRQLVSAISESGAYSMEGERTLVHAYVLILCVMQPALREESDSRVIEMLS